MKAIQKYEFDDVLRKFLMQSRFASDGAVVMDLDGTAVHEEHGRIYIPEPVEFGLKKINYKLSLSFRYTPILFRDNGKKLGEGLEYFFTHRVIL